MKLEKSKEWWLAQARREAGEVVGAGVLALDPTPAEQSATVSEGAGDTRIAFGRFVNLWRRRLGYSVEKMADVADLEASELLRIEDDVHFVPELRTVYKLSQTFDVSHQRLLQLAGLSAANDDGFKREAVRFAARSESIEKLTPEESSALEAFVLFLSGRDSKR